MDSIMIGFMSLDMMLGMIMGMAASPLLMKGIKAARQRRKLDKILHQIAEERKNPGSVQ